VKVLSLMNHPLSDEQKSDLRKMGIEEIIEAEDEIRELWTNVQPEYDTYLVETFLQPVEQWLSIKANKDTWLICTGDFTAFKLMTDFWFEDLDTKGLLLPTTKIESKEVLQDDGEIRKITVFKHVKFRQILSF